MSKPGQYNFLTDVPGLLVGCAEDARVGTGVTVILAEAPAACAVDVRGGGPGTRETDLLAPDAMVEAVDALTFSGGSVYGLAAADAVTAALGARGRGFSFGPGLKTAPIVPGAILFDLLNGGDKDWGEAPPYASLARAALDAMGSAPALGNRGAGYGALAGGLKGGQGGASLLLPDGAVVAALACVNSWGSVLMPGERAFWAWAHEIDGEFGGVRPSGRPAAPLDWGRAKAQPMLAANTTLACVATDYTLTKAQARRVAVMAQDGLARAIRPVHAPFDGDVVFALSTGRRPLPEPAPHALAMLGAAAADVLARAVARGVYAAEPLFGRPAWRELEA